MYTELTFGGTIDDTWGLIDIVDENGRPTDIICIRKPLENYTKLDELLKTKKLIGLSAYQNFPQINKNAHEYAYANSEENNILNKYGNRLILWCHCFKDPQNYITPGIPLLLYSDSDQYLHTHTLYNISTTEKEYDFFCSLPNGEWNDWVRGTDVARKWLNYMADKMNLKILVGGGNTRDGFSDKITFSGHLNWNEFTTKMSSCKYLFNASRQDASPRIIIEALALNLPVLLNQDILGGWKYINKSTGMLFFYDEPVEVALNRFMNKKYEPRKWMELNFNVKKNKGLLANTLNKLISFKYEDFIDGILFINLEDRIDRLQLIKDEFTRAEIPNALIHRIDAVLDRTCGHLGCSKSHIKALEYAKSMNWNRYLILEDDFIFNFPKERILYVLSEFFKRYGNNWDVFMFTTYWNEVIDTDINFIKKIKYGTTTAGYLVNSAYTATLYDNFNKSMSLLSNEIDNFKITNPGERKYTTNYAIDAYWFELQAKDRFFIGEPYIGKQSGNVSSIMSK